MMPKRLQYFVIRYRMSGDDKDLRALVGMGQKRDVVYWGGSRSHCTVSAFTELEILKDYGWEDDWSEEFDVDAQYSIDYPPSPCDIETYGDKSTEGVLAPDGTFYACEYGGHSDLALTLLQILGVDDGISAEGALLGLGYLSIRWGTIGADYDILPTEAQTKWLLRAVELNSDGKYKDKVSTFFRLMDYRRKRVAI